MAGRNGRAGTADHILGCRWHGYCVRSWPREGGSHGCSRSRARRARTGSPVRAAQTRACPAPCRSTAALPAGAGMMSWLRDARLHQEGLSAAGLALLLCLFVATVAGASRGLGGEVAVQLRPLADAEGRPSQISTDGHALLLPGGRASTGSARLRFSL